MHIHINITYIHTYVKHDLPLFATGKEKISYLGRYETTDDWEPEMMLVLGKHFELKKQILEAQQKDIQPCGKRFAKLTLLGEIKQTLSKPIKNINTKLIRNQIFIREILADEHKTTRNHLFFLNVLVTFL